METDKLESFVPFPRYIVELLRSGEITPKEFFVLCYIRINGNPYGRATVSLDDIANDLSLAGGKNASNRIVLLLKKKKLLYFERRSGHRGSFLIDLDDWILPNKKKRTLAQFFGPNYTRGAYPPISNKNAEVSTELPVKTQRLKIQETVEDKGLFDKKLLNKYGGVYNDTDNDTDKFVYPSKKQNSFNKEKRISVKEFEPQNHEEYVCHEIAKNIGEKEMNYLLSILHQHGIGVIEEAHGLLKEKKEQIKNKASYMNGIIKQLVETKNL
jgi:DNA-binding MarR family transcriptional regulator